MERRIHSARSGPWEDALTQYKAMSVEVEVWGASMLGCLEGLTRAGLPLSEGFEFLAKAGLFAIDPEGWYPQQPYLDMIQAIEVRHGEQALRAMARQVPDTSKFPPGIRNLEQALQSLDIAYQLNHRGGRIGHYACLPLGPRALQLDCENPYGCAFDLGILDGLIASFKPLGSRASMAHAPGTTCRRQGGLACTYLVTW